MEFNLYLIEIFEQMNEMQLISEICAGISIVAEKLNLSIDDVIKIINDGYKDFEDENKSFDKAMDILDKNDLTVSDLFGTVG